MLNELLNELQQDLEHIQIIRVWNPFCEPYIINPCHHAQYGFHHANAARQSFHDDFGNAEFQPRFYLSLMRALGQFEEPLEFRF